MYVELFVGKNYQGSRVETSYRRSHRVEEMTDGDIERLDFERQYRNYGTAWGDYIEPGELRFSSKGEGITQL